MARPDLGTKRTCPTTGRKFYDLNRDPVVSPYTGEVLPTEAAVAEPAAGRPATGARAKPESDDEDEVVEAGPEMVSLEDVEADEEKASESEDESGGDGDSTDDTFLEEEEEGGDVSDLIEGDIEDEEES